MVVRRASVVAVLVAVTLLGSSPAVAMSRAQAPTGDREAEGNVTVTVPTLSYEPQDDRFRVGRYRSRLHVLFNDVGKPDPDSLQLVDERGRARLVITIPGVGNVRVVDGYVVLDPVPGAVGSATFSYRASSPNGPTRRARVDVEAFPRVIVARRDVATSPDGAPVRLDIAANDRLVVPGAVRPCSPELFSRHAPRVDPLPIVLPEPARAPLDCEVAPLLRTRHGSWQVDASGQVMFTPASGFRGTATAYYRQASDHPFDLAVARMSVSVRVRTRVLGVQNGNDGAQGPLASTGGDLSLLLVGTGLTATGLALLVAGRRRRRQAAALDA